MAAKFSLIIILFASIIACENGIVSSSEWFRTNSNEFGKVRIHYSDPKDSLKLKAAEFLIKHIDNHFHYQPINREEQDRFFKSVGSVLSIDYPKRTTLYSALRLELMEKAISKAIAEGSISSPKYRKRRDSETLKADFLIENIEYAFKAWEFPWAQNYSFEEFCRFILPYRYGNEAPSYWRKAMYEEFKWIADTLGNTTDPMEVATLINEQFQFNFIKSIGFDRHKFRPSVQNHFDAMAYANCNYEAGVGVSVMRSLGIASTIVDIPLLAIRRVGHNAIYIFDGNENRRYFDLGDVEPMLQRQIETRKIYFRHFDRMENYKPVLEDVTNKFVDVVDLEIPLDVPVNGDIYLFGFGNLKWTPIIKGENKETKVIFTDLGIHRSMYLAAKKKLGKLKPVSDLFSIDSLGMLTFYSPDNNNLYRTSFSRKHRGMHNSQARRNSLVCGEFSAADKMTLRPKQ